MDQAFQLRLNYILNWVEIILEVQVFLLPFSFYLLDDLAELASFVGEAPLVLVLDLSSQALFIPVLLTFTIIVTLVLLELARRLLIVPGLAGPGSLAHLLREENRAIRWTAFCSFSIVLGRRTRSRVRPIDELLIVVQARRYQTLLVGVEQRLLGRAHACALGAHCRIPGFLLALVRLLIRCEKVPVRFDCESKVGLQRY